MQRTTEPRLILIICIYVYILIRLEAIEVVELLAWADNAFFNLLCGLLTIGGLIVIIFARFRLICYGHRFLLLGGQIGCHGASSLRRVHNFILRLRLLANYAGFLTDVASCLILEAILALETLDRSWRLLIVRVWLLFFSWTIFVCTGYILVIAYWLKLNWRFSFYRWRFALFSDWLDRPWNY